jgi:uncharacterized repeat protein (TIGR03803 family)
VGGIIIDKSGNLFGTTSSGGSNGRGTVFEITAAGSYRILYSFPALKDGNGPVSSLTLDSQGNLYGITDGGGLYAEGTVFKLTAGSNGSWQETILYSFPKQAGSCQNPFSNIVFDANGNLYGTTLNGGTWGVGCVYEMSPAGEFTVLHEFGESTDGGAPFGNLVFSQGSLYGTTSGGGENSQGTIFKVTP